MLLNATMLFTCYAMLLLLLAFVSYNVFLPRFLLTGCYAIAFPMLSWRYTCYPLLQPSSMLHIPFLICVLPLFCIFLCPIPYFINSFTHPYVYVYLPTYLFFKAMLLAKVCCPIGTIMQISPTLPAIEVIMTDRTEGISVLVVNSGKHHVPAHPLFLGTKPHPCHIISLPCIPIPHPNSPFFSLVQTPKVLQSVPYARDETSAKLASVSQKVFGMAPRPDAGKITREDLLPWLGPSCVTIGIPVEAACPPFMDNIMNALGVEKRITEHRTALELRKRIPLTPYKSKAWDELLCQHGLLAKHPKLVSSLQGGFDHRDSSCCSKNTSSQMYVVSLRILTLSHAIFSLAHSILKCWSIRTRKAGFAHILRCTLEHVVMQ